MAGSKRNFYYKAGDGNRYTTPPIDESNHEVVNSVDANEEKIPTGTHDNMPSGLKMRYVRMYQVSNPIIKRKVYILSPEALALVNVNTDFPLQTVAGLQNFRISEFIGERRKLQPISDTGQNDGDSDSALAPA